ncbi:MAG: GrpB family protein [Oscillatoriales cyanobacterium C42_A2020_001]|nr:GrpB family protein [Leptolyngbyaceae cyanobacterium C42_A2020_001]
MNVEVVPHNPLWQTVFQEESAKIAAAMGDNCVAIHHIDSTSIPTIYAKPIIDMLVEVKNIMDVDVQKTVLEQLGYEAMGEFGIPGRRYFRKHNSAGIRTHHIHAFQTGSEEITRHLAFRDYMIAHPVDAQQYSNLKRLLAKKYPQDIDQYMDGKDAFIRDIDCKVAHNGVTPKGLSNTVKSA